MMNRKFVNELRDLINKYSLENGSDTPDWILANYLDACLKVFDATMQLRKGYFKTTLETATEEAKPK